MLRFSARIVALVCFFASAGTAFAEGFALYEWGARGMALGGAMYARKPDPSAVAYNPALLTKLKGRHVMGGVTAVAPSGKLSYKNSYDGKSGTAELKDSLWAIPHAYYTHQINDDWYFGIGQFTRFGLGFEYDHDWAGRFNIYEVSLISGSINPNIAWKATDKLSLAGGVELVYVNLDIKSRSPVGNPYNKGSIYNPSNGRVMEVDGNIKNAEAWGVGGNIAAHYQINDQWAVGGQYRSQVRVHAFGDIRYTSKNVAFFPGQKDLSAKELGLEDGTAHSTVILPDSFMGGVSYSPTENLSFEASAVFTRWSMFRSLNIHTPNGDTQKRKHWKDVWRLSAGVEYQATDWLSLRAGYTWDQSPMTDEFQDYLVPTDDRSIYSVGAGFQWDAWTVDLAYAYIDPQRRRYKHNNEVGTINSHTKESKTQLFSISLGYEF